MLDAASGIANDPKAATSAARRARTVRAAVRTAEANAGACDEGSDREEAAASAVKHAYAAFGTTDNPNAMAAAARHVRTARAAVRTAEAHGVGDGARNEGPGNNEAKASAARRRREDPADGTPCKKARSGEAAVDRTKAVAAIKIGHKAETLEEEADNTGVDDNKIASGGRRRPTTATTVADAANAANNKATNGGRRRPKTVTDVAGINDNEVDGRPRPSRRRRTMPASTTTRS